MALRDDIIRACNEELQIADFRDYGPQGMQVEGKQEVRKIVTGVSVSVEFFEKAIAAEADMILVHHGILWDKESHVLKGSFKKRLLLLLQNDMTLAGYHLALDAHPEFGNNAAALKALGAQELEEFDGIGYQATIPESSITDLKSKIESLYKAEPLCFCHGPEKIKRIAVCSGGASRQIYTAIENNLDAFITGEAAEASLHLAKENHIHFVAAGHYNSERLGIQNLGSFLQQAFDVEVEFIEVPNPV